MEHPLLEQFKKNSLLYSDIESEIAKYFHLYNNKEIIEKSIQLSYLVNHTDINYFFSSTVEIIIYLSNKHNGSQDTKIRYKEFKTFIELVIQYQYEKTVNVSPSNNTNIGSFVWYENNVRGTFDNDQAIESIKSIFERNNVLINTIGFTLEEFLIFIDKMRDILSFKYDMFLDIKKLKHDSNFDSLIKSLWPMFTLRMLRIKSKNLYKKIGISKRSLEIILDFFNLDHNNIRPIDYKLFPVFWVNNDYFIITYFEYFYWYFLQRYEFELKTKNADKAIKHYTDKYWSSKGKWLEQKTFSLIKQYFQHSTVGLNTHFKFNQEEGELDVFLRYEDVVVLFECKAAFVSDSAKQGSKLKLAKYDSENLSKANKQIDDFIKRLVSKKESKIVELFKDNKFTNIALTFNSREILNIYRVFVTSDSLHAIAKNTKSFMKKEHDSETSNLLSVSVFELEDILATLKNPVFIIDYIDKRLNSSFSDDIIALDEYDYLYTYVETLFSCQSDLYVSITPENAIKKIESTRDSLSEAYLLRNSPSTYLLFDQFSKMKFDYKRLLMTVILNLSEEEASEIQKGITNIHKKQYFGNFFLKILMV